MLKRLSIRNLGPIESADLRGDIPVNLLLGPNESGKTTLKEALEVLYTGTRGDVEVKGNAALTRAGAKGWSVEAEFDDGEIFKATRSQRPLREKLQERFGDPRVFAAICQASGFLSMKPALRKQLLADLSSSDTLELADALKAEGVDSSIVAAVRAGKMQRAHTLAVDLRRAEDRKMNTIRELAEGEVECPNVETKQGPLAINKVPLDTVETGVARITARISAIRAASHGQEAYERAARDLEAAREELAALDTEAAWTDTDAAAYMKLGQELDESRRQCMNAASAISVAAECDTDLEVLQRAGGDCPVCTTALDSEAASKALSEARAKYAKTISDAKKVQKKGAKVSKGLEEKRAGMLKRKEAAQALTATRAKIEQRIERGEQAEEPSMPAGDLETLGAELRRLNNMRDVRRDFDTRTADKERAQARLETLTGPRDKLAALEKRLDPSAIADEGSLLTELNGHLAQTCGKLGVPVVLNDGYELSIHGRPVGLASRSARLRAGFGVACALSVLSGVGLAFLDDFEALDDSNRKRVLGLLKGLTDDGLLSWVLIAAVKETPKRGADVPWLSWISVKNGTATYLEG